MQLKFRGGFIIILKVQIVIYKRLHENATGPVKIQLAQSGHINWYTLLESYLSVLWYRCLSFWVGIR
jgi:hypothetical protein